MYSLCLEGSEAEQKAIFIICSPTLTQDGIGIDGYLHTRYIIQ